MTRRLAAATSAALAVGLAVYAHHIAASNGHAAAWLFLGVVAFGLLAVSLAGGSW